MSSYLFYFLIFLLFRHIGGGGTSRSKRWLLFTESTQIGMFATISVPLDKGSLVSIAYFFEAQYYNVANASYWEPILGDTLISSRNTRSIGDMQDESKIRGITRNYIYQAIEATLEQRHGLNGRECLLRAICDTSKDHFKHNGLVGDLLEIILTPTSSMEEEEISDEYYFAELVGHSDMDCSQCWPACPYSVLDFISSPAFTSPGWFSNS